MFGASLRRWYQFFFHSVPYRFTITRGALWFILCLGPLNACLPPPETPPPPSPTSTTAPTLSPTATITIMWFPPTPTFTPFALNPIQPTPDMRPALADLLLADSFLGPQVWPLARTKAGSAAYGSGEFTLVASAPDMIISSLRPEPVLSDYYLEIDAFPSLCREQDAYGLILRAQSLADHYRLLFTCSGQMRVDRIKDGKATPLQTWQDSGMLTTGALVKTRLGVWALGSEMRFFVNDIYQFSVRDPLWTSGKIGLLARAAGSTPLTVSFSNLIIRRIDPDRLPTPTPVPSPTIKPSPTPRK